MVMENSKFPTYTRPCTFDDLVGGCGPIFHFIIAGLCVCVRVGRLQRNKRNQITTNIMPFVDPFDCVE